MKSSSEIILIVDDHEINRYATKRVLQNAGFDTIEAASGQEAIQKAHGSPTLILLDVNLPDIDGFQVCKTLRSNPATADIPIVHTSATFVSEDDRIEGLETGADGYLTRPIEPRVLIATIRACLRARLAEAGLRQRERELQSMADNTPAMIARFNPQKKFVFVNRSLERALQVPAVDCIGKSASDVRLDLDFSLVFEHALDKAIATKEDGNLDFWLESLGNRRRYACVLTPEVTGDGAIISVLMMALDITEQFYSEKEREKFVSLVEYSRDFIAIYDTSGRPTYINQAGLFLVGLGSLKEAQETQVDRIFSKDEFDRLKSNFIPEVIKSGHGECEIQVRNLKSGELHWLNCSLVVQRDEHSTITGYSAICRDITERKMLEEQLRIAANDLRDANTKMNEFLATLAHELRNPLAPIRTGLEVIRMSADKPELVQETRAIMERQTQQMIRLIDDLLDLSRITQGKLNLKIAKICLVDVLESAIDAIRPFIDEAGHELQTQLETPSAMVAGDPNRLTQVFANILGNASKYTSGRGKIILTARRNGNEAVVSIKDNGLGIPVSMQSKIFDMFTQIDRPMELGYTGLGIGLTLVKRIVELHGGTVAVNSEGDGKGSEFIVRIPVFQQIERSDSDKNANGLKANVRH
ncbi:MAG TPA: ATP-binding protein, partial [Pirellula sp.]|nr:ATP-binding protein [Pirellula sp.]